MRTKSDLQGRNPSGLRQIASPVLARLDLAGCHHRNHDALRRVIMPSLIDALPPMRRNTLIDTLNFARHADQLTGILHFPRATHPQDDLRVRVARDRFGLVVAVSSAELAERLEGQSNRVARAALKAEGRLQFRDLSVDSDFIENEH